MGRRAVAVLSLGLAVYRACHPSVALRYPQSVRYRPLAGASWRLGLALAALMLFLLYIRPDWLGRLFDAGRLGGPQSPLSATFLFFNMLLPLFLGAGLGNAIYVFRKYREEARPAAEKHEEAPRQPWKAGAELICLGLSALAYGSLILAVMLFGPELFVKLLIFFTIIFTYLATKISPGFFAVAMEGHFAAFACNAALSLYLSLGLAVYRSFRPPAERAYPQFNDWRFGLASAALMLFLLYIRPDWLEIFFKAGRLGGTLTISTSFVAFTIVLPFLLGSGLGSVIRAGREYLQRSRDAAEKYGAD